MAWSMEFLFFKDFPHINRKQMRYHHKQHMMVLKVAALSGSWTARLPGALETSIFP